MCGIAGVAALEGALGEADARLCAAMTAVLRPRGPDGERVLYDGSCALGNARLKVTDLSDRAALPLESEDGGVRLAFNGAITNFESLRAGLAGPPPRTGSDAEVLLRLYQSEGIGCLERLSGMFAFFLHDRAARRAWLVRDFYGLRPVFWRAARGRFYFASELKALLETPGAGARLDRAAVWDYFSLGYIPGARTPFADLRELRAGRLLELDLARGRVEERRYYALRYEPDESLDEPSAAARLREALRESVRRSLRCDAPAGLTLSGGVDTSGLLALAKDLGGPRPLRTYSVRVGEPSFDEGRWQRLMVEFAGSEHREVSFTPEDVERELERAVCRLDEPTGDGAAIPMLLLAREAAKDVRVLLSGEGGDELFNAYETHRAWRARRLYRAFSPAPIRRLARGLAAALPVSHDKLSVDFVAKRFSEGCELTAAQAHLHWRRALSDGEKAALLPGLRRLRPTSDLFAEALDGAEGDEELDRLSELDLTYYFVDDLMVKNDRMLMAASVEARFPYMDRPVVELAARIPARLRLKGLRGRHIQKAALRGLVPDAILARSNMGLETPYSRWLAGPLRPLAERWLSRERVAATGLLDADAVRRLWDEHLARRRDHGRALWSIIVFLVWFERFVVRRDYKRVLGDPA